jgi:hypothetical protein
MGKVLFLICCMFVLSASLSAQKFEPVTVRAGMRVVDCFPFNERYLYPEFISGRIYLKSGVYSELKLNYDILNWEMEYINKKDTLAISNKKDIRLIVIKQDTFFYDKGFYLEQIHGGTVKVVQKQCIKLKETQKQDSYGTSSSGSATNSYGMLPSQGNFYKLTANEDMLFQRKVEYYLSDKSGEFVPFSKKNLIKLYPQHEDKIKAYLKSVKVNFEKCDDVLELAEYLKNL